MVGNLFRNTAKTISKRELLIFITPRIVDDTVSRNH
jgi:type IV pilus assembly protein PilQ